MNQTYPYVGFLLLVTPFATLALENDRPKEIARLICRQRDTRARSCTMKERQTRGMKRGQFNECMREKERIFRRLSYNFVWVGRSTATTLSTPSNPRVTPSSVSFSFRLNVTIITGKALHTHAANRRARRRNYIDISIVSASRLIN